MESDYIRMGDSRRPTPSHVGLTLIVYGNRTGKLRVYGYTRGSGRVWVASSATGTGRVAEMVDPYTPNCQAARI